MAATASQEPSPLSRLIALDSLGPSKSLLHQEQRDRSEVSVLPASSTPALLTSTQTPHVGVIYTTLAHLANTKEMEGLWLARNKFGTSFAFERGSNAEHNFIAKTGIRLCSPQPSSTTSPSRCLLCSLSLTWLPHPLSATPTSTFFARAGLHGDRAFAEINRP